MRAGRRSTTRRPPTGPASRSPTAATTTTPAVDPGPREVPVVDTITRVTPPPGNPEDPFFGSVGDEVPVVWRLTGPCDGAGPCELAVCECAIHLKEFSVASR